MSKKNEGSIWGTAWKDALRITSLGWDLAVPILGGAALGYALNRRFHTGNAVTVALLFLGVLVGFYNVGRQIRYEIERDRRRAEREQSGEVR